MALSSVITNATRISLGNPFLRNSHRDKLTVLQKLSTAKYLDATAATARLPNGGIWQERAPPSLDHVSRSRFYRYLSNAFAESLID